MLSRPESFDAKVAASFRHLSSPEAWLSALMDELNGVIVGLQDLKDTIILGLLCHGHVLIEGNPGLAKTLTAKTLGTILGLDFKRIQATPDLTPTDMLGTTETRGPIFAQILLVDEINRAQPKTQSALLEAMEERQVSVKGRGVKLPEPFLVLATQNPIEQEGTNPLPEAQLDRFMFQVIVDYPDRDELRDILRRTTSAERASGQPLGDAQTLRVLQRDVRERHLPDAIEDYIARLVLATHPDSPFAAPLARRYLLYGASPRGAQSLALGGKAMARLRGRAAVTAEDVRTVLVRSLQHRMILNFEGVASGIAPRDILANVVQVTEAPTDVESPA
jgi:MoxR-like ATPase